MPHPKLFQNVGALQCWDVRPRPFRNRPDLLRLIGKNCGAYDHANILPSTKARDFFPTDYSGPPSTPKNVARRCSLPNGMLSRKARIGVFRNISFLDAALLSGCRFHPETPTTEVRFRPRVACNTEKKIDFLRKT